MVTKKAPASKKLQLKKETITNLAVKGNAAGVKGGALGLVSKGPCLTRFRRTCNIADL